MSISCFLITIFAEDESFSRLQCDCPIPCEQVIYDPVLTYGTLSNFDTETLLDTKQKSNIQVRYSNAKEMAERVITSRLEENTNILVSVDETLQNVIKSMHRVAEKLAYSRTFCNNVTSRMNPRINFHMKRALDGVKDVVHNNFVRGWEVIVERTVHHLTTEFYESINACDRTIKHLQTLSSDEITARKIAYLILEKDMSDKLELAIRSIDNITTAYYCYLEGKSIVDYGYRADNIYDKALIPVSLLFNLTSRHKEYYENISTHLTGYVDSILIIKTILKDVYQSSDFNETAYTTARERFIYHSKRINYYLFLFTDSVVMKSEDEIDERIKQFKEKNDTFQQTVSELSGLLGSLSTNVMTRYKEVKDKLEVLSGLGQDYLTNTSHTKASLADRVLSKGMQDLVHSVKSLFREIHLRGHMMRDWWMRMRTDHISVWMAMIRDETTKPFYSRLARAVEEMTNNSQTEAETRERFAHPRMLGLSVKQKLTLSAGQLRKLLNADIPYMSAEFETMKIVALFDKVMKHTNILESVGTADVEFFSAFERLSKNMRSYQRGLKIDTKFLR